MTTIQDPYAFGDTPPAHLMGWAGPEMEAVAKGEQEEAGTIVAYSDYRRIAEQQSQGEDVTEPTGSPIWNHAVKLLGEHFQTYYQKTGDCVSMGCATVAAYRSIFEISALYQEETFRTPYPPYTYGLSRCHPSLGNNRLRRQGAGSTGAWGAGAMKMGCLFSDDDRVQPYTGSIADAWGRDGVPNWAVEAAKDNPMLKAASLSSVDEIRHELINRRPVTIASNRGFNMQPREVNGLHVFTPSGSWAHQMCLIEWRDDPFPAAYRMNSWGANAHGNPLNGEPPGGAWNLAEDLERELRSGGIELYACSLFAGHPSEPDPGIL